MIVRRGRYGDQLKLRAVCRLNTARVIVLVGRDRASEQLVAVRVDDQHGGAASGRSAHQELARGLRSAVLQYRLDGVEGDV